MGRLYNLRNIEWFDFLGMFWRSFFTSSRLRCQTKPRVTFPMGFNGKQIIEVATQQISYATS